MKIKILLATLILNVVISSNTANAKGLVSINSLTGDIEDWWMKCGGSAIHSTCLQNRELSRFKTLCMREVNKADCRKVVDYAVAKSRLTEAKNLLLSGKTSLRRHYLESRTYPKQPERIWESAIIKEAKSFAVGILPSCLKENKKNLLFGSNLRPEVAEYREFLQRYYEKLTYIPCPTGEPTLVVVGLIHDSNVVFDTYTIDSENKFKTISSALRDSPFTSESDEIVSMLNQK